jgi:hypothetical protein
MGLVSLTVVSMWEAFSIVTWRIHVRKCEHNELIFLKLQRIFSARTMSKLKTSCIRK